MIMAKFPVFTIQNEGVARLNKVTENAIDRAFFAVVTDACEGLHYASCFEVLQQAGACAASVAPWGKEAFWCMAVGAEITPICFL